MNLYDLTERYQQLFDLAVETSDDDGRLSPEFVAMLASLEDSLQEKLGAYWRIMKNLAGQQAVFEAEARRLAAKAKSLDQHFEHMKATVKETLVSLNMQKWENGVAKFRLQKNPPSVKIDDEAALPADAMVYPQPYVSLSWIKAAIDSGKEVPGAHLETGCHVRL